MKRSNRLILGIGAAAVTFASLTMWYGTDHWKSHAFYHHRWDHHQWDDCHHDTDSPEDAPLDKGE